MYKNELENNIPDRNEAIYFAVNDIGLDILEAEEAFDNMFGY